MIRSLGEKILMALCIAYVVISFGIYAGTNAEEIVAEGHKDRHHEKDILQRTKRYALARVPLTYSQPRFGMDLDNNFIEVGDDGGSSNIHAMEKRYSSNMLRGNPAVSHFREVQARQRRRPLVQEGNMKNMPQTSSAADQLQTYRNLLQYYGIPNNENDVDLLGGQPAGGINAVDDVTPLTDEELQTLLLLLGGYKLSGNPHQQPQSPRNAQYYSVGEDGPLLGKRETGKRAIAAARRSKAQLEQPMSFENSVNGDSGAVFIGQKRSKRIGNLPLRPESESMQSSVRIKKQTDPAVEASLDKVFAGVSSSPQQQQHHQHQSIPTTAISSSNHQIIPPPSSSSTVQKKAINWSEYFGIDKRSENEKHSTANDDNKHTSSSALSTTSPEAGNIAATPDATATNEHHNTDKASLKKSNSAITFSSPSSSAGSDMKEKSEKLKEKKDKSQTENDTEVKDDRKWILKEFYKNLAMATNVRKRKRESPNEEKELDKLEKIERKMEEVGDQMIWDALKYTGAHKDAQLSPEELARVKNEIIHKLSAAYSLEKVREAIDEFRQKLAQLKDKQQQHY